MLKKLIVICFAVLLFLGLKSPVYARDEFLATYHTTYAVTNEAETDVTHHVILQNRLANIYATAYTFILGSTRLAQIQAYDAANHNLDIQINKEANQTKINISLQNKVVGKDKTQSIYLQYRSYDYASLNGKVLSIGIPQIIGSSSQETMSTVLRVPTKFGQYTFISPTPQHTQELNGFYQFTFANNALYDSSIIASFGNKQIFNFNLTYFLENDRSYPIETEIALIPDTNRQTVIYSVITPPPQDIILDQDGNWLAQYYLPKKSNLNIVTSGKVQTTYQTKTDPWLNPVNPDDVKEKQYWELDSPVMASVSANLANINQIYQYVVDTLNYDYDRVNRSPERQGAIWALANPNQAVCMEFTDLFVTLARANHIPAREINGYAQTDNPALKPLSLEQDVLHAWPQYYDQSAKIWVDTDPTWEKTTGGINYFQHHDLNRIVFAIHGANSTYPLSAGAYKSTDQNKKSIDVSFGSSFDLVQSAQISIPSPLTAWSGLPFTTMATITNSGNGAIYHLDINIKADKTKLLDQDKINVSFLAPGMSYQLPIKIKSDGIFGSATDQITVSSKYFHKNIDIIYKPFYLYLWTNYQPWILAGGGVIVLLSFMIILIKKFFSHKR